MSSFNSFLFEITGECPFDCTYCYAAHRKGRGALMSPETAERLVGALLKETKIGSITLIGGEPLTHPDIASIASVIVDKDISVAVTTNGLLLDDDKADSLLKIGVRHFEVSLDTVDESIYRKLGRGKNVDVVKQRIASLCRKGAFVTVSCVMSRLSIPGISSLVDFCFAAGVQGLSLLRVLHQCPGPEHHALAADDAQIKQCLLLCNEKAGDFGMPVMCSTPLEKCRFDARLFPHIQIAECMCGASKWTVDAEGNMRYCEISDETIGNILEDGFSPPFGRPRINFFQPRADIPGCSSICRDFASCGGGCCFVVGLASAENL
jgi:radical SAM protein with 4Fe4S-binding SPASM domain